MEQSAARSKTHSGSVRCGDVKTIPTAQVQTQRCAGYITGRGGMPAGVYQAYPKRRGGAKKKKNAAVDLFSISPELGSSPED